MRAGACLASAGLCVSLVLTGCAGGGSSGAGSDRADSTVRAVTSAAGSPAPRDRAGSLRAGAGTPSCQVPARFRGQDVTRLPVSDKVIALTFDAGANADGVPAIRRTLREKDVRATFFLTGTFVRTFPVKSARIGRQYLVGNHSLTHPDLTTLSDRAVQRQVREAERLILAATGQDPRRFFRFPYGANTAHTVELLNALCYVPFRWTVDTLGWKGTSGGMTAQKVLDRVLAGAVPGAVVLMHVGSNPHDGTTLDADALPAVIERLRARGFAFVPLSRVMSAVP